MSKCPSCGQEPTTGGCGCPKEWIGQANRPFTIRLRPTPPQGWQCPECSRYISPYEKACPFCCQSYDWLPNGDITISSEEMTVHIRSDFGTDGTTPQGDGQ